MVVCFVSRDRGGEEDVSGGTLLSPTLSLAATHASDVLDMPVDPNEPTYCLCHQVSYGEMIGCDNNDVRLFILYRFIATGLLELLTRYYLFVDVFDKRTKFVKKLLQT